MNIGILKLKGAIHFGHGLQIIITIDVLSSKGQDRLRLLASVTGSSLRGSGAEDSGP